MAVVSELIKISVTVGAAVMLSACSIGKLPNPNYDADDPNVETYLGVNYKTDIPQSFDYILFSRHGTFDQSVRVVNTGTLIFNEEGLEYENNSGQISIPYDSIVSVKRLTVPVGRVQAATRRDTWVAIRFDDGNKVRRVGFRGDLARAHPWTGDRLVGLLRSTLAKRDEAR